jgi:N-acetylglucosamine-6-phosphate deacetylase
LSGCVLSAANIATPCELVEQGFVVVEGGSVLEVGRGRAPAGRYPHVELGKMLIAPGYVDLHVHGGGGSEVNCATREQVGASVRNMAHFHAMHGTTALVATTVSDHPAALRAAVEGVASLVGEPGIGILGSNLEGPWISRARAGAQFPGALRAPSVAELEDLVARSRRTLRLVTVAPELDGALNLVAAACEAGLVVSIGHTDADYETAVAAFDAGARHATHLFNAMAPVHQRAPGPVAAALADHRVSLEIIADGVHVHPALISLVATLAPDRLVFITDAIGATGALPGLHRLGPLEVLVKDGRAVLADHEETAAGSVLTMDNAVALAVRVAGVPLLLALRAASLHPAMVLAEKRKGYLGPGADADIVVLDRDLSVVSTIVGGRIAHDPTGALRSVLPPVPLGPGPRATGPQATGPRATGPRATGPGTGVPEARP